MSASPDLPSVVRVTVVTFDDDGERQPTRGPRLLVIAVLVALTAAIAVPRLASTRPPAPAAQALAAQALAAQAPAALAQATTPVASSPVDRRADLYRYPLGCMGGADRAACWHYGVYVTAILAPVHGTWQIALEAVSRSCPVRGLPAAVRAQVVVCLHRSRIRQHVRAGHPL